MVDPVRVGLVGAGPWARAVTGPVFAAGPETTLAGVWSRTEANARTVADALGVPTFTDLDALFDACDAVAVAVTPDAQPAIARRAAAAGKALLLEKPLAGDVAAAEGLVDAIGAAGVPSLLMLTNRFNPLLPPFAEAAAAFEAVGGRGCFLSGAFLPGSPYANGWRLERGALLDIGPHLLDLHEIGLGEITEIHAAGDVHGWISATLTHASGVTSQASMCSRAAMGSRTEVELFGPSGTLRYDGREADPRDVGRNIGATFAAVARGAHHPSDGARGLHLQRLIAEAERQLTC